MIQRFNKYAYRRGFFEVGALAGVALAACVICRSQQEGERVLVPVASAEAGFAGPPPPPNPPQNAAVVYDVYDYDAIRNEAQLILRASLKEPGAAVRVQGTDVLGEIQESSLVTTLITLTETDPDDEVRGRAATALGTMGAAVAQQIAKLEAAAPPLLKVSYASALARRGDKEAARRLLEYARGKELAVSFKAGLALAEVSQPGDAAVLGVLKVLAAREAELSKLDPHAQTLILTRMAALRDANARKVLYALLEDKDPGARLAAAEGLAKLGDDAGRKVLQEVLADPASPSFLVAVQALIPLGEHVDCKAIAAKLADKDPGIRRLAARVLGALADRESLPALLERAKDPEGTVRVAVAAAIVAIVDQDPQVLAHTSADWAKQALASQDRAERRAAAGVLADLPDEKLALRLLARASADPDPGVRRAVAESAGKMRSAGAAAVIAVALKTERDPDVKEQQVRALGEIGSPTMRDMLAKLSQEPGRLGVLAAGSQIAAGDVTGLAKLEAAITSPQVEMRLAAVQAAWVARNPIVIPTLKIGVVDRVFDVRFLAAEVLSFFRAEEALAVPVLTSALESKDASVVGRALAALIRFGKTLITKVQSPADMLDSTDPKQRLATVSVVGALPLAESVSLLRRLLVDLDRDVRHAAVEAIASIAPRAPTEAAALYSPLVHDADPVVRAKASGQLARLRPPLRPPPDPLRVVRAALDETAAASVAAKAAAEAFDALAADIARKTSAPSPEEAVIEQVQWLAGRLDAAAAKIAAAAAKAELASQTASDAAGASPSPDAVKLVAEARGLAQGALDASSAARQRSAELAENARIFATTDVQVLLDGAATSIATDNLPQAKQQLDRAKSLLRTSTAKHPELEYLYAQLYERMSAHSTDPAEKLALLQQAMEAFQRFVKSGTGPRIGLANDRVVEISNELKELEGSRL